MSTNQHITTNDFVNALSASYSFTKVSNLWYMSAVDWVCKKISLESASEQLSAIMISCQQVLHSNPDACANVTTCCWVLQTYEAKHVHCNIWEYLLRKPFPRNEVLIRFALLWPWNPNMTWLKVDLVLCSWLMVD